MIVLSALAIRYRTEPGFNASPFYIATAMYVTFVYISLGQLKIYVGGSAPLSHSGGST